MPESVVHCNTPHERTQGHPLSVETGGLNGRSELASSESPDPPSPKSSRDSSWLQVEVCRDFRRETCPRGGQCRFAHPDAKVMGRDGKVTCCYDFLKVSSRCWLAPRDYGGHVAIFGHTFIIIFWLSWQHCLVVPSPVPAPCCTAPNGSR